MKDQRMWKSDRPYRPVQSLGGLIVMLLCAALVQSCAVGPDYVKPEYDLPDLWQAELVEGLSENQAPLSTWWEVLDDPILDSLMERAVAGNLDLKEAFARINESRAVRGVAKGERYPDVNADGELSRRRQSEDFGALNQDTDGTPGSQTDWVRAGNMNANWEVDLWGRVTRSIRSADAEFVASVEDYRDILVVLYADIAANYVELRTLQERIVVTQRNVDTQRGTLGITKARFKAELSPELDVRQAELNLHRTESVIPALRQGVARAIHRLGVLIGEFPGELYAELTMQEPIPQPPPEVLMGVPAEIMRQRPDIRAAERRLAAQTERIGIATADLYPTFFLLGDFGYIGVRNDFFDSDRETYSFGPTLRWNIFDGGRVRNRIIAEDARSKQALARYENTVLEALEDVENAAVEYTEETQRREFLRLSVVAAQKSVELVSVLYKSGLTDFQNVLDMERSLAEQEDRYVESVGFVTQNLIAIYRALGGGWDPDPPRLDAEVQDAAMHGEPIF
ncbi:MAG: efflux transporter outer membrane subunit [Desulfobacterales bacterium]|nr:efflux transporter outer membrane subunit [Desulfobacterales bacterium]MDJ0991549.1 efflux transporter outer membrane subunit [Desulfobacterales bacterium]